MLDTCHVIGFIKRADDTPLYPALVTFTLPRFERDTGTTITPATVTVATDPDGKIEVDLWPNSLGTAGTFYYVQVIEGTTTGPQKNFSIFKIVVPDLDDANLADITELVPPAVIDDVTAIIASMQLILVQTQSLADQVEIDAQETAQDVIDSAANAAASIAARMRYIPGGYQALTAYLKNDVIEYQGSTWIALINTTDNPPPSLPTTSNTQWSLVARVGAAGEPLIVMIQELTGVLPGIYPFTRHSPYTAGYPVVFAEIIDGTGTVVCYIHKNGAPVYGPFTVTAGQPSLLNDLNLALSIGDTASLVVSGTTELPVMLLVQIGVA